MVAPRPVGWVMAPAAALVGRLRYAQKFAVVGLVLLIPLGVIAGAYVNLQRGQMAFSDRERLGVAYLAPLGALTVAVVAARHDQAQAGTGRAAGNAAVEAAVGAVDAVDGRVGDTLAVRHGWASTRRLIAAAQPSSGSTSEQVQRYDRAVDALLALIVQVGDASNLTLDPDLDTFYLMDLIQFRLPAVLDTAARVMDAAALAGTASAASGNSLQIQLGITRGVITSTRSALGHDLSTVIATTRDEGVRATTVRDGQRLDVALRAFTASLDGAIGTGRADRLAPGAGVQLRQTIAQTSADAARSLDLLLHQRIDGLALRADRVVAGAVLAALLAVYLFLGFYVSVVTPIRRIVASLRAVAAGDLTQQVEVNTRDEMRFVAEVLNDTVSQTRKATALLTDQATLDGLTGLPNRMLVLERLEQARAAGQDAWVLFVDLDRFKQVNDSFGHESGDEVLCEVAYRLRALAGRDASAGRLAGDEFVLITGPGEAVTSAESLGALVVQRLSEPIALGTGRRVTVGASVGIAALGPELTAEEVLRRADLAMYDAKRHGRGRTAVYDDRLSAVVEARAQVRSELRDAVDSGAIRVHYQPIVDVGAGRIAGFEALARWEHPERGLLMPDSFIEVAEDSGLIVPLGTSVLATACRHLAARQAADPATREQFVCVNVSALQLAHPGFVAVVAGVLAETGLPPSRLCLEITETSLMADVDRCRRILVELRRLGVRLAVDDFGVGYSSLSYLSRFPMDTLKLDKSFVSGMLHDPHDATIVSMLIGLGRSLDMSVVAEGVEQIGQRDQLLALGYSAMQGYLFGRPGPVQATPAAFVSLA